MNVILPVCAGVALAAACGFRVFLPLLALAVAARAGIVNPSAHFQWLASGTSLVVLGVATVVEVAAYYIPWLDHALDVIATPAAVAAGTLAVGTTLPMDEPAVRWALAVVAGGGAAGAVQAGTVTTRAASGVTTGGLGNPIVATLELIGAFILSVLAVVLPVVAALLVLVVFVFVARRLIAWWRARGRRVAAGSPI